MGEIMAYNDYKAWVYCNGKRRQDRECLSGFFHKATLRNPASESTGSFHATLGDYNVILAACKCWPELWVLNSGELSLIPLPGFGIELSETESNEDCVKNKSGCMKLENGIYKWWFNQPRFNMIELMLIEPNGTVWKAQSGYRWTNQDIWQTKLKIKGIK